MTISRAPCSSELMNIEKLVGNMLKNENGALAVSDRTAWREV